MESKQKGIVVVLALLAIWGIFFQKDKYDGMTAEEWAGEYEDMEYKNDWFRGCVEDYSNMPDYAQQAYGGVFYYCD